MLPGVSKTAILTMRARVDEDARADRILVDPLAAQWWKRVTWPSELDAWYASQYALPYRADDIDRVVARYATAEHVHTVVELGVGLSTRFDRLSAIAHERWVDVDLPEVVALRREWGLTHDHLATSVLDHAWMDHIDGPSAFHVFIIEGLLYYLPRPKVDELFRELARRFAGSIVVMDVLGTSDFPKLLENTRSVGTPIDWAFEGPYDTVLDAFGLEVVPEFEPSRLTQDMLARYWHRFYSKLRGAIVLAQNLRGVWEQRSGVVLGRLR